MCVYAYVWVGVWVVVVVFVVVLSCCIHNIFPLLMLICHELVSFQGYSALKAATVVVAVAAAAGVVNV